MTKKESAAFGPDSWNGTGLGIRLLLGYIVAQEKN
jgi:hypothetical protein